jgi:hypothetical protein
VDDIHIISIRLNWKRGLSLEVTFNPLALDRSDS